MPFQVDGLMASINALNDEKQQLQKLLETREKEVYLKFIQI